MEKKIRFFWMYTILLFSVAFVLILFSAISAGQHQDLKEDTENYYKGAQATMNELTDENTALKTTLEGLNASVASLSSEVETLREQNDKYKKSVEAVLTAEELCKEGSYSLAKETLKGADKELLEGTIADIYDDVTAVIENNI